jgi:hypothetical protein
VTEDGKSKLSFVDKVKLITNCYYDNRLKRLMTKSDKRLTKELDLCRIVLDLKSIHNELGIHVCEHSEKEEYRHKNIHLDCDSVDEHDII